MSDATALSVRLSRARKEIKQAHQHAETWTEEMGLTVEAIDALGLQHYGSAGEDMPTRVIKAQVRAMADLTYTYAEQAYEAKDGGLTFFDESQREAFDDHLDEAHEAAMTAQRAVEDEQ